MNRPGNSAFTVIELLVVIAIIGILFAILLPVMEKIRHKGYLSACAANLHTIGQSLVIYSTENHGAFPRTRYQPGLAPTIGTGAASANPFDATGPDFNDVTASVFLLLRTQKLPSKLFICPYNDVYVYEADHAEPLSHSNFTEVSRNLGYSFMNPYPDDAAVHAGFQLSTKSRSDLAIASDKNPGTAGRNDDVTRPTPASATSEKQLANSNNHEKDGQNVLFGDGHVEWKADAFCGANGDNIFTNHHNLVMASPVDRDDSVLLPTDDPPAGGKESEPFSAPSDVLY